MVKPEHFGGFSNQRVFTYAQSVLSNKFHRGFHFFRRNVLGFAFGFGDALDWNADGGFFEAGRPEEAAFYYHFLCSQQAVKCFFYSVFYLRRHFFYAPCICQTFCNIIKVNGSLILYEFGKQFCLNFSVFGKMKLVSLPRIIPGVGSGDFNVGVKCCFKRVNFVGHADFFDT